MRKAFTIVSALAVGLVVWLAGSGRLMNSAGGSPDGGADLVQRRAGRRRGTGHLRPLRGAVAGWPKDLSTLPGHEKWTYGGARGIFAESPESRVPARRRRVAEDGASADAGYCPMSVRTCSSPLPACRGATPTGIAAGAGGSRQDPAKGMEMWRGSTAALPRARRRRALAPLHHRGRRAGQHHRGLDAVGQHVQASACRLHQPVRSRRSMSGSSTTTRTRSTSSPTTASSWCRRSARPTCRAPMGRISTGRPSWRGCRTAASTWPTATTARASRSSTPTASSCSTSACRAIPARKRDPAT